MSEGAAFRGQPLLLLGGLTLAWLALRVAVWQPPFEEAPGFQRLAQAAPAAGAERTMAPVATVPAPRGDALRPYPLAPAVIDRPAPSVPPPIEPSFWPVELQTRGPVAPPRGDPPAPPRSLARAVVGHNLLLLAGLAQMELPPALVAYIQAAQPPAPGVPAAAPMLAAVPPRTAATGSRWAADAWLLLRHDMATPILSVRPSYGRSQAGAVVRYRLAGAGLLRPQAYLRASTALSGPRERDLAAGISARPLAALPLRFAVEARVSETASGTRLRPAAFAITEFPPLRLPLGMRAEAYAQGGYVGGDFATAFVDGQARVERSLVRRGELELSAGAGTWGGAEEGTARLDVGPTASLSFRLGPRSSGVRGRVAADYRLRIAGQAEPSSGPALTVSAGF